MDHFNYRDNILYAEEVPVAAVVREFGTPCFIYSRATLERHFNAYKQALSGIPSLICYAVKANSNLAVINVLARLGAGFDIVSGGELERVLMAGGSPDKIIFSGLGKTVVEIEKALSVGIHCFNVESMAELDRINEIAARLGKQAPISLRVNPDVDAQAHPYISTQGTECRNPDGQRGLGPGSERQGCLAHKVAVYSDGRAASLRDSPDNQRLTPTHVARGEHPGHVGHLVFITANVALPVEFNPQLV